MGRAATGLTAVLLWLSPISAHAAPSSAGGSPGLARSASHGWKLTWSDEFNGPAGSPPNPAFWTAEVGGNGWGNEELEFYTARPDNARLDGQGQLIIEARREKYQGRAFTSARLITKGKFFQAYGRFEARIKLPTGRGIWPAFWIMGNNIDAVDWPRCGEIDVLELLGQEPGILHGTLHGPVPGTSTAAKDSEANDYRNGSGVGGELTLPKGESFPSGYHDYAVEWRPGEVRWLLDGKVWQTKTPADVKPGTWVFDHPFFLLLNVAVGGDWPGPPDATTVFPQPMLVDRVRVFTSTASEQVLTSPKTSG